MVVFSQRLLPFPSFEIVECAVDRNFSDPGEKIHTILKTVERKVGFDKGLLGEVVSRLMGVRHPMTEKIDIFLVLSDECLESLHVSFFEVPLGHGQLSTFLGMWHEVKMIVHHHLVYAATV